MGAWIAANCVIAGCPYFPKSSIPAAGNVLTKKFENNGRDIYDGIPATFIQKF